MKWKMEDATLQRFVGNSHVTKRSLLLTTSLLRPDSTCVPSSHRCYVLLLPPPWLNNGGLSQGERKALRLPGTARAGSLLSAASRSQREISPHSQFLLWGTVLKDPERHRRLAGRIMGCPVQTTLRL